ncbi:MAG: hypothetical protein KDD69_07355, partial [Bdellovibrionales bacterium]|nr:hypothetical protein [Bdellovibrionales bacterium]
MIDLLRMQWARLKPARTIDDALLQVLPRSKVLRAQESLPSEGDLLTHVAECEGFDTRALVREVARRFGIGSVHECHTPTSGVIRACGHSVEVLRQSYALPQATDGRKPGYALVIADPEYIDLQTYRRRGVAVRLATREAIDAAWRTFDELAQRTRAARLSHKHCPEGAPNHTESGANCHAEADSSGVGRYERRTESVSGVALVTLRRLVADAEALGATEIFIGHPEPGNYEFTAGGNVYSGRLNRLLFASLLQQFGDASSIELAGRFDDERFYVARTRNFSREVLFLSWHRTVPSTPPASLLPQASGIVTKPIQADFELWSEGERTDVEGAGGESSGDGGAVMLLDDDVIFAEILGGVLQRK